MSGCWAKVKYTSDRSDEMCGDVDMTTLGGVQHGIVHSIWLLGQVQNHIIGNKLIFQNTFLAWRTSILSSLDISSCFYYIPAHVSTVTEWPSGPRGGVWLFRLYDLQRRYLLGYFQHPAEPSLTVLPTCLHKTFTLSVEHTNFSVPWTL